jgi:hypothetical protein
MGSLSSLNIQYHLHETTSKRGTCHVNTLPLNLVCKKAFHRVSGWWFINSSRGSVSGLQISTLLTARLVLHIETEHTLVLGLERQPSREMFYVVNNHTSSELWTSVKSLAQVLTALGSTSSVDSCSLGSEPCFGCQQDCNIQQDLLLPTLVLSEEKRGLERSSPFYFILHILFPTFLPHLYASIIPFPPTLLLS